MLLSIGCQKYLRTFLSFFLLNLCTCIYVYIYTLFYLFYFLFVVDVMSYQTLST